MTENVSRRSVLKGAAGTGAVVGLAGCTGSIPGMGGGSSGDPCGDVGAYFDAAMEGDAEAAIEYVPYEWDPNTSREDAVETHEMSEEEQSMMEEMDISIDCEENRELDDGEIEELNADLESGEITDARELSLTTSMSGEMMGEEVDQEEESTGIVLKIDGDGWYIWEE